MHFNPLRLALYLTLTASILPTAHAAPPSTTRPSIFSHDNLIAWCIVPFDAKKRSPEERAAMLERLGITHFAYDWRAEHLPTFAQEIDALNRHHVELSAVWFPTSLDADARFILDVLKKRGIKTELWVIAAGTPIQGEASAEKNVDAAVRMIRPLAEAAELIGCTVTLYNHGGWFGEPENQLAVLGQLNNPHVKMIYNLHHGHEHLARFKDLLPKMLPHLTCITLNGMTAGADKAGRKILPIGQGDLDLDILRTIRDSGYSGRLAILNHTDEDAEIRLQQNLQGLDRVVTELEKK